MRRHTPHAGKVSNRANHGNSENTNGIAQPSSFNISCAIPVTSRNQFPNHFVGSQTQVVDLCKKITVQPTLLGNFNPDLSSQQNSRVHAVSRTVVSVVGSPENLAQSVLLAPIEPLRNVRAYWYKFMFLNKLSAARTAQCPRFGGNISLPSVPLYNGAANPLAYPPRPPVWQESRWLHRLSAWSSSFRFVWFFSFLTKSQTSRRFFWGRSVHSAKKKNRKGIAKKPQICVCGGFQGIAKESLRNR